MEITVVLTTLNEEEHIERCLESLYSQSRMPDQVVLVDGHSDDDTVDIARPYDLEIYFDDEDLASARNLGIERADGDIVVFTDVDGYFDENWLEEIERGFEEYPDTVGIQGKSLSLESETLAEKAESYDEGILVKFTHGANMAFRKEILEQVGGFDSNDNCGWEDMDLGYRVSKHGDIRYWPHAIQYEKKDEENFGIAVRNGRYWIRFIAKHRKPQWIIRPYYYVLLYIINREFYRGLEEGAGMTFGILKELANQVAPKNSNFKFILGSGLL